MGAAQSPKERRAPPFRQVSGQKEGRALLGSARGVGGHYPPRELLSKFKPRLYQGYQKGCAPGLRTIKNANQWASKTGARERFERQVDIDLYRRSLPPVRMGDR